MEATGYFVLAVGSSGALGALIGIVIVKLLKPSPLKPIIEKNKAGELALKELGDKIRSLQEMVVEKNRENLKSLFGESANTLISADPTFYEFVSDPYGLGRVNVCFNELLDEIKKGNYNSYLLKRTVSLLSESMMMAEPQIREKINNIICELDETWYTIHR